MPFYAVSNASRVTLGTGLNGTKIVEMTVTRSGKYLLSGTFYTSGNGGGALLSCGIKRNGVNVSGYDQLNWDLGQNTWGIEIFNRRVATLEAGDVISLWGGNSRGQAIDTGMAALSATPISN